MFTFQIYIFTSEIYISFNIHVLFNVTFGAPYSFIDSSLYFLSAYPLPVHLTALCWSQAPRASASLTSDQL